MKLETNLKLTHAQKLIMQSTFERHQESLLRIYSGDSLLFKEDSITPEMLAIIRNGSFQNQLSDDFLKYQEFLDNPDAFSKADITDLAIVRFHLYTYRDEFATDHGTLQIDGLINKIVELSEAHHNLEPHSPNPN